MFFSEVLWVDFGTVHCPAISSLHAKLNLPATGGRFISADMTVVSI